MSETFKSHEVNYVLPVLTNVTLMWRTNEGRDILVNICGYGETKDGRDAAIVFKNSDKASVLFGVLKSDLY